MDKEIMDTRLKGLEEEITLLSGHISTGVAKELADILGALDKRLDNVCASLPSGDTKDAFQPVITELTDVKSSLGAITTSLGVESGKDADRTVRDRLDNLAGTLKGGISDLGDILKKSTQKSDAQFTNLETHLQDSYDTGMKSLDNKIDLTSANISAVSDDLRKNLLHAVEAVALKADTIVSLLGDGIGDKIDTMSTTIRNATANLPELPDQLKKQLADIDTRIGKRLDSSTAGIEEAKATLMKDHDELHRSLEIIRRMCTTDEEKYLGSLVSLMYDRVEGIVTELPEFSGIVKQKLSVLDKNIQVAAQNSMVKQDEVKKLLLYDIKDINDTAISIRDMCDTGSDTSLGDTVAQSGEHIDRMSEHMPEILSKVNDIATGMDHLTAQMKLMRWFVVGAVGISLAVLAVSMFT